MANAPFSKKNKKNELPTFVVLRMSFPRVIFVCCSIIIQIFQICLTNVNFSISVTLDRICYLVAKVMKLNSHKFKSHITICH